MRSKYIYIVGTPDGPVKIGHAANLKSRLTSLQIGCPDKLVIHATVKVPGHLAQSIETAVHRRLEAKHRRGEWFDVHKDEAEAIAREIAKAYCEDNQVLARRYGDTFEQIESLYPIDPTARKALVQYLDRNTTPHGRKEIARADAYMIRVCGPATFTLFKKILVEGRSLYELFLELRLDSAAKTRAEASLAKAINTLADYAAWHREQELLALTARRYAA